MRNLVANTAARTLVAEEAPGDVLGFTRFGDDAEDAANGHIFALYVATGASGKGVGRRLLERAIDELDPCRREPSHCGSLNETRARRFYEARASRQTAARASKISTRHPKSDEAIVPSTGLTEWTDSPSASFAFMKKLARVHCTSSCRKSSTRLPSRRATNSRATLRDDRVLVSCRLQPRGG